MQLPFDESEKRRLTDRAELTVAAEFLISRGIASDEIGEQLSRYYYVDIDELNEVVAALERAAAAPWQRVA